MKGNDLALRPRHIRECDPLPVALEKHIVGLGLQTSAQYLDWCEENGFRPWLEKSATQLQDERDHGKELRRRREKQTRLHKHPKDFLRAVCAGDVGSDDIDRPMFKTVAQEIEASNEDPETRASLADMLVGLARQKDLIFGMAGTSDTPLMRGLIKLHDRKALWLRPLSDWKPKSKNALRQFGELTHFLFDKYGDVPQFMEGAWLRNDRPSWRYRDWYIHLGRGHNLRKAKSPVTITKRMAHEFLGAPKDYTVEQAIRWAQLRAMDASRPTIDAVAATRLGRSFVNEEFWITVLRFIADNPMLDPRQIGPMIDYVQNQKFEAVEVEVAPGQWRREPPAQPGFSMRHRNVQTLLAQVDAWHRQLGSIKSYAEGTYDAAPFNGATIEKRNAGTKVNWIIRQLRTHRDLVAESNELRHCVSSYHWSCARGDCTIWSLATSTDGKSFERRQTIEVSKDATIVQCRGFTNKDPTPEEWSIVSQWASLEGLQISSYL